METIPKVEPLKNKEEEISTIIEKSTSEQRVITEENVAGNTQRIQELEKSVSDTKARIDTVRAELGIEALESDPPSIVATKEKIADLQKATAEPVLEEDGIKEAVPQESIAPGQKIETETKTPEQIKDESMKLVKEGNEKSMNLKDAPTDGLFKGLKREELLQIRNEVIEDSSLVRYYELTKKRLISESGLSSVHRGHILNEMYKTLVHGGVVERSLAKKLERLK